MLSFWLILYLATAITFLIAIRWRPYRFSYLVKIIPIVILMVVAFTQLSELPRLLVISALLFSAAGDIALDLRRTGKNSLFVVGLLLFLIAHLFYISAFMVTGVVQEFDALPILIVLLVLGFAAGLVYYLWPRLGKMRLPVLLYVVVIFLMVLAATFHAPRNWLMITGAILFAISDGLIAIHKFGRNIPGRDYWVMGTYYLAQLLIVSGFLAELTV
jgi:uncharacterized membrane protein YhhN